MALISRGSLDSFSASLDIAAVPEELAGSQRISVLRESSRDVQPAPLKFAESAGPRGMALKSLRLTRGSEGFLRRIWDKTNEVYFVAWAWDFSGAKPSEYPGLGASPDSCIVRLKAGQVREYLGAGAPLFAPRNISAGLALRLMVWESDKGVREFGKAMVDVSDTIKSSKLTALLSAAAVAGGMTTVMFDLIKDAALELGSMVGKILQANSDDLLDLYEGFYPVADDWTKGEESYAESSTEIVLSRLV